MRADLVTFGSQSPDQPAVARDARADEEEGRGNLERSKSIDDSSRHRAGTVVEGDRDRVVVATAVANRLRPGDQSLSAAAQVRVLAALASAG
jgi:hypothetical protein